MINDLHKGIHIFDNSNPENPVNLAFYPIPGNVDLSVKDNILYADNILHLLSIDIEDPIHPKLININEDVFASRYYYEFGYADTLKDQITVEYIQRKETVQLDCDEYNYFHKRNGVLFFENTAFNSSSSFDNGSGSQNIGIGGSTSRFTIVKDALYTVLPSELHTFDLSDGLKPEYAGKQAISWNAETIFPFQEYLLIGTRMGLLIYNIADNPLYPRAEGEFGHVNSCDPVVAEENIAYVTLWSGSNCGASNSNQLDILDISNKQAPVLIGSHAMKSPRGLGLLENRLFVCEAEQGVSLFNTADPRNTGKNLLARFEDINAQDVIPINDNLILFTGSDGIGQYKLTDDLKLVLLSKI